ncbi:terminase family protein [Candidatus Bathyarchaeota archaeon]|nr:terminase family protein [Candidatus Bathyarchaeota archaeon]
MSSRSQRLRRVEEKVQRLLESRYDGSNLKIPTDPMEFAVKILKFNPAPYQAKILTDNSRRIAVRICRQGGKTTVIAARAIWFAAINPKTTTIIIAPSQRQSINMMDVIHSFIYTMDEDVRRSILSKALRTTVYFRNGSRIIALPNNPRTVRGYTAHQAIVDEANFIKDDELLIDSTLRPQLGTTDGPIILCSTPWSMNSVFYRAFNPNSGYSRHIVTWRDAVQAGILKESFMTDLIDEVNAGLYDRNRFMREYEVEFVEETNNYFQSALITRCQDAYLEYYRFDEEAEGRFYVGVDFGKKSDHSAVAVIDLKGDERRLVHLHRFPLETPYTSVIGYVKAICDRYMKVQAVYPDQTGVGEYIVEEMVNSGILHVTGINLTAPVKEDILGFLKHGLMEVCICPRCRRRYDIKARTCRDCGEPVSPLLHYPYDPDLIAELNIERYEYTKDGRLRFTHPDGTHDDMLWALALACYATKERPSRPETLPVTKTF